MIDDKFSFKYSTLTKAFYKQLSVSVVPVLFIPDISGFHCQPRYTVRTFDFLQATGLSALYGPLIFYKPPASVHCTDL